MVSGERLLAENPWQQDLGPRSKASKDMGAIGAVLGEGACCIYVQRNSASTTDWCVECTMFNKGRGLSISKFIR